MSELMKNMKLFHPSEDDEVFCIAYGSNLSVQRMMKRCPGADILGTSVIHGYRLLFKQSMTGAYATIEQDANCAVPVVIYKITAEDEAALDRAEGYPKYYRKQEFLLPVWDLNGRRKRSRLYCIAYIMREYRILGEPPEHYFSILEQGYMRWDFDREILIQALEDSIGRKAAAVWLKKHAKEDKT